MNVVGGAGDGSERRRFPRADLVFRVRYRSIRSGPVSADVPNPSRATGRDISLGGVSFRRTDVLDVGDVLHMSFYFDELPGEIAAVGRVIRSWDESDEPLVAVRFTVIDPDDCNILDSYIRQYEGRAES